MTPGYKADNSHTFWPALYIPYFGTPYIAVSPKTRLFWFHWQLFWTPYGSHILERCVIMLVEFVFYGKCSEEPCHIMLFTTKQHFTQRTKESLGLSSSRNYKVCFFKISNPPLLDFIRKLNLTGFINWGGPLIFVKMENSILSYAMRMFYILVLSNKHSHWIGYSYFISWKICPFCLMFYLLFRVSWR